MGRLDNKVAVITGAASGMGRATAVRFAGEGAAVVIADLNQEGGEAAVRECKENGGRAVFHRTDVTLEAQVKAAVDRAVAEFGRLDIMYNNAGIPGVLGRTETIRTEDWDRTMAVLLRAVFLGMKYAIPAMRRSGGGSIISTSSVAGLRGSPQLIAYCTAKAAVINLTRAVAVDVAKDRIRVNCICPGGINTPLFSWIPGGPAEVGKVLAHFQPIPRAGTPEDIAAMALFLASDEAEWITGQAMVVDGGLTAGDEAGRFTAAEEFAGAERFLGPSFQWKRP